MKPLKIKVLIEGLKTSNEVMKKQIELSNRTIELLGDLITEPESVKLITKGEPEKAIFESKHFIEPTNIKPEDMVRGEWYVIDERNSNIWLFKFNEIINRSVFCSAWVDLDFSGCNVGSEYRKSDLISISDIKSIRKATRKEVLKYFPHEFEIPTHGANDIPNIPQVTDEQL